MNDQMHQHSAQFEEAIINEWMFKTEAMRSMTLDVCRLAIARGVHGNFSALDLPKRGADAQGGTGIAGSVLHTLADRGIIAKCGVRVGEKFYPETVVNNGGNPINLYRLTNPRMAQALINRHEATPVPLAQSSLDLRPSEVFA